VEEPKAVVLGVQLALWFKDRIPNPEDLLPRVRQTMGNIFDRPTTVLPMPPDQDLDYAQVVILQSSQGLRLAISRKRADLWIDGQAKDDFENMEDRILAASKSYLTLFEEQVVVRSGLVVRFLYPTREPSSCLERLLTKKPSELQIGQTFDVGVTYITRHIIGSRMYNDRTEIGQYQNDNAAAGRLGVGVQVTRDFNSLPDDATPFLQGDILALVQQSKEYFSLNQIGDLMWTNH